MSALGEVSAGLGNVESKAEQVEAAGQLPTKSREPATRTSTSLSDQAYTSLLRRRKQEPAELAKRADIIGPGVPVNGWIVDGGST